VTATNLPGGLLVYAAGEGEPVTHQVVHIGKELEVVTLDLCGSPSAILAQVRQLASRVAVLRGRATAIGQVV
jgi:hypothetical protein